MGAPSGLRSTAPLFPPACSSIDFVLPGLVWPLVCGTACGLLIDPDGGGNIGAFDWGAVMPGLSLAFCALAVALTPTASAVSVNIVANFIIGFCLLRCECRR